MSKPDLRTVVCNATGPRSLAGGRVIAVNGTADGVDVNHPHNRALIDAGDLAVIDNKPRRARRTTQTQEEAA